MEPGGGEDWKRRLRSLGIERERKPKKGEAKEKNPRRVDDGRMGEDIACSLFKDERLVVLDRNVRYRDGELDIVARDGAVVVFAEVKWRRNDARGTPAEAVTLRKQARVVRAARRWLAAHPSRGAAIRFDVVAIRAEPPEVLWIRDAFDASGSSTPGGGAGDARGKR